MKVAIVGGRSFREYYLLEEVMDSLHKQHNFSAVVCGEAAGADSLGKVWAKRNNIPVISFKPNWDKFGRSAGHIRNCEMLEVSDKVVAFWNLFSPGTSHMINIACKNDKLLHLEEYND
jgi:hypothetical protein